jgi:hypothetical protein
VKDLIKGNLLVGEISPALLYSVRRHVSHGSDITQPAVVAKGTAGRVEEFGEADEAACIASQQTLAD